MEHPADDVLLRFLLGATDRQENRQVVRHLLARCPRCAAALRRMRKEPTLDPPLSPDAYDAALDRAAARLRAREDGRRHVSAASGNVTPRRGSG